MVGFRKLQRKRWPQILPADLQKSKDKKPVFVRDGVVDPETWARLKREGKPRILYILKESHKWQDGLSHKFNEGRKGEPPVLVDPYSNAILSDEIYVKNKRLYFPEIDLAHLVRHYDKSVQAHSEKEDEINKGVRNANTWRRLAEWQWGMMKITESPDCTIAAFPKLGEIKHANESLTQASLKQCSFINLIKGSGESKSSNNRFIKELNQEVDNIPKRTNLDYLRCEIEIIDPSIIVLCGTSKSLFPERPKRKTESNWLYSQVFDVNDETLKELLETNFFTKVKLCRSRIKKSIP